MKQVNAFSFLFHNSHYKALNCEKKNRQQNITHMWSSVENYQVGVQWTISIFFVVVVVPLPFYCICEFNENDICELKDEQQQKKIRIRVNKL